MYVYNSVSQFMLFSYQFHFRKEQDMPVEILTTQASIIAMGMADTEPDYSVYENKTGLADDLKFLASMPELCDVTFLVGDTREPVCAVKVKNPVEYIYKYILVVCCSTIPPPTLLICFVKVTFN